MKILKVIHGYPPRYCAGSEVYSKTLCHELSAQGHEVIVFTRNENAYQQEYSVTWERDSDCKDIKICLINMVHSRDGYEHAPVNHAFGKVLDDHLPDLVHIGHLNHLSTSLILEAHRRSVPIVFTLHDFWLMCPRGQFLQATHSKTSNLYPVCNSQDNEKCARICYSRYFSSQDDKQDSEYWTHWVDKRMQHIREMSTLVNVFIAPSLYLMNRFKQDFGIPSKKIRYLDYGFKREQLQGRKREQEDHFVFGYIGTHKQAKGIHHLIQAFSQLQGDCHLKIWGNSIEPFTKSLKTMVAAMPPKVQKKIMWMEEYRNEEIVSDVFNHIDAVVVPSIWGENSPLVIHEAIEARIPVITADFGGMKEYIHHEVNGLLFKHRDIDDLARQMNRMQKETSLVERLRFGGYVQSPDKRIPSIETHAKDLQALYNEITHKRKNHYESKIRPLAHHL